MVGRCLSILRRKKRRKMEFNYINIIFHTVVALAIAIPCGKAHEFIHIIAAKRLGYKINKIEWWKNEVDIAINQDDPNNRKIARAPYYVMIPFSLILIYLGWHFMFLGVGIAGVGILFLHILTFKFEGRDREKAIQEIIKK